MPRMNECFMGFWFVFISPPGRINNISFLSPDRDRGSKISPLPSVVSSLLQGTGTACSAIPSGRSSQRFFGAHFLTHSLAIKKRQISIECFGWSTAPELPPPSVTTLDQEPSLNMDAVDPSLCVLHWADSLPAISFDGASFRFLLAVIPRIINRSCFFMSVLSVVML